MPRGTSLPQSLRCILDGFSDCFTAPTFKVFSALVVGFIARPASRTVCGMLTGAGLARFWHHARAHRFFAVARWSAREVGLALAALLVRHLLGPDEPILLAVDETLFRRRGPKVHAIGWWHDGSAAAGRKVGLGNSWVVAAIIVRLPFLTRPVALPVLAALCTKPGPSKPALARGTDRRTGPPLPHPNDPPGRRRRLRLRRLRRDRPTDHNDHPSPPRSG